MDRAGGRAERSPGRRGGGGERRGSGDAPPCSTQGGWEFWREVEGGGGGGVWGVGPRRHSSAHGRLSLFPRAKV